MHFNKKPGTGRPSCPHNTLLYDMLQRNACVFARRPAVITEHGVQNFAAFLGRVEALASSLAGLSIAKGDRVCILAQNHPEYLEVYGACAKLGLQAYPLNWRLSPGGNRPYCRARRAAPHAR